MRGSTDTAANVVVVGFGLGMNQRLHHCEAVARTAGLTLYGICDIDTTRHGEAQQMFHCRTFARIDEVLADPAVDVVSVATPNDSHAPLALQCLAAGKHVVLEKPMCMTLAEADALIDAARRYARLLTVRHNRRWDGDYLGVREIVDAGTLGEVHTFTSAINTFIRPSGWRAGTEQGGGEVYDWGSHLTDQALRLIPARPVSVFSQMRNWVWNTPVDTYGRIIIVFENGAIGDVELSNIAHQPRPRWFVQGARGGVIFDGTEFRGVADSREIRQPMPPGDGKAFYRNVSEALQGKAELVVKPEQVRTVMVVLEAAFASARRGEVVKL